MKSHRTHQSNTCLFPHNRSLSGSPGNRLSTGEIFGWKAAFPHYLFESKTIIST